MLQNIRDKSQGWIAWAIIIAISLTFALWGIHNYVAGGVAREAAIAKVNGHQISSQALKRAYERLLAKEKGSSVLTKEAQQLLRQQALQQLITSLTLTDAAQAEGFRVSIQQLDALLEKMPSFQEGGKFSKAKFEQVLSRFMYSEHSFVQDLNDSVLMDQAHGSIVNTAFILPAESSSLLSLLAQSRTFNYLNISKQLFLAKTSVHSTEVKQYYEAHQQRYQMPEKVSVAYIMISAKDLAKTIYISPGAIKSYYQAHIATFSTKPQWKVSHILIAVSPKAGPEGEKKAKLKIDAVETAIKKGGNFSRLAKQFSTDVLTAKKGGSLGWIDENSIGGFFQKTVETLQVGQVSTPVRTRYGYEIIKLDAKRPAKASPLAKVRHKIADILKQQALQKAFSKANEMLTNLTYENPGSLKPAAKALNLPIQTTTLFTRQGLPSGLASHKAVIQAAFSDDALLDGNNSSLIQIDASTMLVLRVKKHEMPKIKPLAKVRSTISQYLKEEKAKEQTKAFAEKLLRQLRKGADVRQYLSSYHLAWFNVVKAKRTMKNINTVILDAAFSMPKPLKKTEFQIAQLPSGNYVIIALKKVSPGNVPGKENLAKTHFEQTKGAMEYSFYMQSHLKSAKVKLYNKNA